MSHHPQSLNGGSIMDGSGTINPAALNTPGMCFLYRPHTARAKRASQWLDVVVVVVIYHCRSAVTSVIGDPIILDFVR